MHGNDAKNGKNKTETRLSRCAADRRILRRVFFAEKTRRLLCAGV